MDSPPLSLHSISCHTPEVRKRRILLLFLGCAILATALSLALTQEQQPTARGHPLSYWVERDYGWSYHLTTPAEREEATLAIRELGTNALPLLLKWMEYEPSRWKLTVLEIASRLPTWVPGRKLLSADAADVRAKATPQVFRTLGATAAPAVPELEARAQDTRSKTTSRYAFISLCNIGSPAVPSIAKALSNPVLAAEPMTATYVATLGTNAQPLVSPLLQYLDDTNADIVLLSVTTLSYLRLQPDIIVPALARKLADPRPAVRYQVMTALTHFGSLASPALPQLTNAFSDANLGIRQHATNAIQIITTSVPRR